MLNFRNLTQLPAFSEAAAMENPMATRDQEPPPRGYISGYTETSTASKWVGVILGAVLLAFIAYMLFAAMSPSPHRRGHPPDTAEPDDNDGAADDHGSVNSTNDPAEVTQ
jgi:hypothetical protein